MFVVIGCGTPSEKIKQLRLGMTPEEVIDKLGKPSTIRAAKVYEDGQTQMVWEYLSGIAIRPKDYWVFFENDRVVQWGEPGDFSGRTATIEDYKAVKQAR
jgi:outer membrane protein assembly factor BamE (lipoprotein component of BamABCDE complex)